MDWLEVTPIQSDCTEKERVGAAARRIHSAALVLRELRTRVEWTWIFSSGLRAQRVIRRRREPPVYEQRHGSLQRTFSGHFGGRRAWIFFGIAEYFVKIPHNDLQLYVSDFNSVSDQRHCGSHIRGAEETGQNRYTSLQPPVIQSFCECLYFGNFAVHINPLVSQGIEFAHVCCV